MTLYYTLPRFWFVPQLVERRRVPGGPRSERDCRLMRDRSLSEETGILRSRPPHLAGHDALLRLRLRLVLGSVNPEDLRALLAPQLLDLEVVHGARLLHLIQGQRICSPAGPRGV